MNRETCARCGGTMAYIGLEKLQLGQYGIPFGHLGQLFSGALAVDIYCCKECKKLEFYAAESEAAPEGEADGIPQVPCPICGRLHEMDDAVCPYCGRRLMD